MADDALTEPLADEILRDTEPVRAAREGLAPDALDAVHDALFGEAWSATHTKTLAHALGVSERTLSRRKLTPGKPLPPAQSDRLLLVAETYDLAVRALGGSDRARAWLNQPHRLLSGEAPMDRLDTLAGTREVQTMLYHLEYGMAA